MKKIKYFILLIMAILCSNVNYVNAYTGDDFIPGEYIPNVYIKKIRSNGTGQYRQGRFIRKKDDNSFVYCLQPFVDVISGEPYNSTSSDYELILNMTSDDWNRVALISYYGYNYKNHTDYKWYYITQVLIWRVADPTADIYFTNTLNGMRNDNLFLNEINELNTNINSLKEEINGLKNEIQNLTQINLNKENRIKIFDE